MIIDAGPALNFFASNNERILVAATQRQLAMPETVRDEILRKAKSQTDRRFAGAEVVLNRLMPNYVDVLSDDVTDEMEHVAQGIIAGPLDGRMGMAKDLGETMVVLHAARMALAGEQVIVIIDDQGGQGLVALAQRWLQAQSASGQVGLATTEWILTSQIGSEHIPDRAAMRSIYQRMRGLDDGLVPIASTGLLTSNRWSNTS